MVATSVKNKQIKVVDPFNLYKWAKNFKKIQDKFYNNNYKLDRLQKIEDFITLNSFTKVHHIEEVRLDLHLQYGTLVDSPNDADLILVTHQGYSRYPCVGIIEQIKQWTDRCPNLYLCLNRHYINIDNQKINEHLPDDYLKAITVWLRKSLPGYIVTDLSSDYVDRGDHFTWSIPDRHYYIIKP